jgi:hypothetical protein
MRTYDELPGLEHLYLEDSFVLGIDERDGAIAFTVEAVLTEGHPRYHSPLPGEQHCYARVALTFRAVADVEWPERSDHVFTDPDGSQDLGGIDFLKWDGDRFDIAGDWGHVLFRSAPPEIVYLSDLSGEQGRTT